MNFKTMFKLAYLYVTEIGGDYYKVFEPKLETCSIAYDSGDIETATAMLHFIASKVVELREETI